jgi:hypothetical protein
MHSILRRILIAAITLVAAGAVYAQAYRRVDANGVTHYSDRPQPGAVRIELPKSPGQRTLVTRPAPGASAQPTQAVPAEPDLGYQNLSVATPGAEETLWNIGGTLSVSLNLEPALQPGHRVRAYFDGEPQLVSGTSFEIAEVYRGVHNIQVEVIDQAGQLQIRSQTNRFYVQQNTVVTPARAGN